MLLRHPGTERISAESPQMAPVDLECLSLSTTLGAFVVMAGEIFGTTSALTSLLCSSIKCGWIGGARMNLSPERV